MRKGLEAINANDLDTNRTNVLLTKPQNLTCEYVTLAKGVHFLTPHPSRPNLTLMDHQPLYHRVHPASTPTNLPPFNLALTGPDVFALLLPAECKLIKTAILHKRWSGIFRNAGQVQPTRLQMGIGTAWVLTILARS